MERHFSEFQHYKLIADIYNLQPIIFDRRDHSFLLRAELASTYLKARNEPSKIASIETISDVISSRLLGAQNILVGRPDIEREMDLLKSEHPTGVHYHVNMEGKKAFFILSEKLCDDLISFNKWEGIVSVYRECAENSRS